MCAFFSKGLGDCMESNVKLLETRVQGRRQKFYMPVAFYRCSPADGHISGYHSCIILGFGFILYNFSVYPLYIRHSTQCNQLQWETNIHSNVKHFERNFVIPITEIQIVETMTVEIQKQWIQIQISSYECPFHVGWKGKFFQHLPITLYLHLHSTHHGHFHMEHKKWIIER